MDEVPNVSSKSDNRRRKRGKSVTDRMSLRLSIVKAKHPPTNR